MVIRNNKGYLRLIEMALAATLIIGFLLFIQDTQSSSFRKPPSFDTAILKETGQDILRTLDLRDNDSNYQSDLRTRLDCNDTTWDKLSNDVSLRLPQNMGFTLYFFNETNTSFRGGYAEGLQPARGEVVAVNYVVAGEYGNYSNFGKPCGIKLALWFTQ